MTTYVKPQCGLTYVVIIIVDKKQQTQIIYEQTKSAIVMKID